MSVHFLRISFYCFLPRLSTLVVDSPVETKEVAVQASPETHSVESNVTQHEGNCIMKISHMEDFMGDLAQHAATCGVVQDGAAHSTMCGEICIDGAGGTRSYGKGYKGTTAAANVFDMLNKLPLDVKCMQASY